MKSRPLPIFSFRRTSQVFVSSLMVAIVVCACAVSIPPADGQDKGKENDAAKEKAKKEAEAQKKIDEAAKIFFATIETSVGTIKLELNREKAKDTVDNFVRYARSGYYEGTLFHRVEKDYIVQGGGFRKNSKGRYVPKGTGNRKTVKSESGNGLENKAGTIAASRWAHEKDSAKAEFFINLTDNPQLNEPLPAGSGFTVFGKVTKGMEIVNKIAEAKLRSEGVLSLPGKKDGKDIWVEETVTFLPAKDIVIKKVVVSPKVES